jgi:hypothetical protein
MGPPRMTSAASGVTPSQCASRSRSRVPTGTIRLAGRLRPWPVTVTMRSMSGMPVSKTSAIAASDPTFCTTTPTDTGSWPEGTSTPVTDWMSIFSAPCGYFTVRGRMVMSRSCGFVFSSAAIASGLFRSTPMTAFVTPRVCIMIRQPRWTRSGYSTIVRWSDVRYGSHSAPLTIRMVTVEPFGGTSFT